MNRLLRYCVPVLCAGLMPILSTGQNTPPAAATPGAPPAARTPQKPKNLKVLPENTDLRKVMRQYAGDLGVECEFCHTAPDPVTHRADRASDANPVKETARYMIQMTSDLNDKYLADLPGRTLCRSRSRAALAIAARSILRSSFHHPGRRAIGRLECNPVRRQPLDLRRRLPATRHATGLSR